VKRSILREEGVIARRNDRCDWRPKVEVRVDPWLIVVRRTEIVIAESQVEGQPLANSPVILEVCCYLIGPEAAVVFWPIAGRGIDGSFCLEPRSESRAAKNGRVRLVPKRH